jgi:hypothetical protein
MRQLVMEGRQSNIFASYLHPGCLDWDTHYPPDEQENRRNLRLWERMDEGQPVLEAWAIFSRHEGTFDLFVSPALYGTPMHETVMDEYVVWAEARARASGVKQISPFWAMEYDTVLERLVKARGFVEIPFDPAPPLFERSLDDVPPIPLPEGFTVQGVSNLDTREEAEGIICEGYATDRELPMFFGKIMLFGEEKWMIDFDTRDYRFAAFHIIENHNHRIHELLADDAS